MPETTGQPEQTHSAALLQSAIERLKARGDAVKRFACMQLDAPVFHDLCERLMDRTLTVKATAEWLAGQVEDAPTRSSVERFSEALQEEYRLAQLAQTRASASGYVAKATDGDPDAMEMAAKTRLAELLTDALLRTDTLDDMDDDRIFALTGAMKAVAQVGMSKQLKDAKLKDMALQLQQREARIDLLQQQVTILEGKAKAAERETQAALNAAEKAAAGGKGGAAVVDAIKQALGIGVKGGA